MKFLKFLKQYNPLELLYLYEQNAKYTFLGVYLGFPTCCIQAFINEETQSVIKNYPRLPSKGTGYVPGLCCTSKVETDWAGVQKEIATRRTCSSHFPEYLTIDNPQQLKEMREFKKIFTRHMKRLVSNIQNYELDIKKEINRSSAQFNIVSQSYHKFVNNDLLDKLIHLYIEANTSYEINYFYTHVDSIFNSGHKNIDSIKETLFLIQKYEENIILLINEGQSLINTKPETQQLLSEYIVQNWVDKRFDSLNFLNKLPDKSIKINNEILSLNQLIAAYIIYQCTQAIAPPLLFFQDEYAYYMPAIEDINLMKKTHSIQPPAPDYENFNGVNKESFDWVKKQLHIGRNQYTHEDILAMYEAIDNKEDVILSIANFNLTNMNQEAKEKVILEKLHLQKHGEVKKFKI